MPRGCQVAYIGAVLRSLGKSAAFMGRVRRCQARFNLTTIVPQEYDGTFLPSNSVRTVTPPNEATELANVTRRTLTCQTINYGRRRGPP